MLWLPAGWTAGPNATRKNLGVSQIFELKKTFRIRKGRIKRVELKRIKFEKFKYEKKLQWYDIVIDNSNYRQNTNLP